MFYNIYFSPTGGTKRVAEILVQGISAEHQNIDLCKEIDGFTLSANDVCLFSVPSYSGRVPEIAVQRICKIKGNGTKAILNCVYGNRAWEDTLTELEDTLEERGFVCTSAVAAVAEHSIFRQFAAGRPDSEDEKQLIEFAGKINAKLKSCVFENLHLEGSHGTYREISKDGSMKPEVNELCTACGLCAESCPVGAIDKNDPHKTDREACMGCMRCLTLCPNHARDFDASFIKTMSEKFAPRLSGRKENYLFI